LHGSGLLFANTAAGFAPDGVNRRVTSAGVQPSRQSGPVGQGAGLAGQIHEHRLRNILGQMHIPIRLAQSNRVHKVNIHPDQLSKGHVVALFGVQLQEFTIGGHEGNLPYSSHHPQYRTKK